LKKLSEDRLVLVVTHDKYLAELYGDRAITLKDGQIVKDVYFNEETEKFNESNLNLKPISPSLVTSMTLGVKSFRLNLVRYILIILLFSASLIFAGSVINLFLADTTKEYADYQKTYNNFVVDLNKLYDEDNYKIQTGFNLIEYSDYSNLYTKNNEMTAYKSTIMNFPITNDENAKTTFFKRFLVN
jgi:ABC-type multidrug transport system ATPase subunit